MLVVSNDHDLERKKERPERENRTRKLKHIENFPDVSTNA